VPLERLNTYADIAYALKHIQPLSSFIDTWLAIGVTPRFNVAMWGRVVHDQHLLQITNRHII